MSGFKKATKQAGNAWGQVEGGAHDAGDMLQGLRGGGMLNSAGLGGTGKIFDDIGAEANRYGQRAQNDPWGTFLDTYAGGNLWRKGPGARGATGLWHHGNMQLNPQYAGNFRRDQRQADQAGQQAALEQRQGMTHGGIGGGGAQVSAEIQRYNQVLQQFAAQQQALRSQGMQGDMEMIRMIAMLMGGGV